MIDRALLLMAALGGDAEGEARSIADRLNEQSKADRLADALVEALERIPVAQRARWKLWSVGTAVAVLFASVGATLGLEAVTRALALDWGLLFLLPLVAVPLAAGGLILGFRLERRARTEQSERAAMVILERLLSAGASEPAALAAAAYISGQPEKALAAPFSGVDLRQVAAIRLAAASARTGAAVFGAPAAGVGLSAVVVVGIFWAMYFFAIGASALSSGLER